MRGLLLALLAISTACDPVEYAAIVVAPPRATRADSGAQLAFRDSAVGVAARIAKAHGLVRVSTQLLASEWLECLQKETFGMCGGVRDSLVTIQFREWARFGDTAHAVRREVLEALRDKFGFDAVHECDWHWPKMKCPRLAQIDSSR